MKMEFKHLVRAVEANELGRVREHFQACDGFAAAQDMARLVDALANGNAIILWGFLQAVHKWER